MSPLYIRSNFVKFIKSEFYISNYLNYIPIAFGFTSFGIGDTNGL